MTRFIASIAAVATFVATAPALASNPAADAVRIDVAGLSLANAADARLLNQRVASAKEAVCGSFAGAGPDEENAIRTCRATVDRQIAPQLAALRAATQVASR